MTDEDRLIFAKDAARNPVIQEAFKLLREQYVLAMRQCDAKDDLGRYRYTVALTAVDAAERHIKRFCDLGNIEQAQITELQTPKRWFPKF